MIRSCERASRHTYLLASRRLLDTTTTHLYHVLRLQRAALEFAALPHSHHMLQRVSHQFAVELCSL